MIAADLPESSLAAARAIGADKTVDLSAGEVLPADSELVFEASGALGPAPAATARGGTLVQVGNLPGSAVSAVLGELVTREITWLGSYRFVDEITDAVAALAGGIDVSPLITTHTFDINDAAAALAAAGARSTGSSKVLLRPSS